MSFRISPPMYSKLELEQLWLERLSLEGRHHWQLAAPQSQKQFTSKANKKRKPAFLLADSQQQTLMEYKVSLKELRNKLVDICSSQYAVETCGFVAFDKKSKKYVLTVEKNESPDPANFFIINPVRFLNCKNKYDLIGVFHSHITADETPSEFDIKMSEACCVPFVIYSLNTYKFSIYSPKHKDVEQETINKITAKLSQ